MSAIYDFKMKMRMMILEWRKWAEKIAKAAKEVFSGECEVYVFGSIAKGSWSGGSDVDILIIVNREIKSNKERGDFKALIEEKAQLPLFHPFEIHLVTTREAAWYWKHIKNDYIRIS